MAVHIPVGELAVSFIVKMGKHEYWVNIDERAYETIPEQTYFVPVIYRDGKPAIWYEAPDSGEWRPRITFAAQVAMDVIVADWEASR